MTFQRSLDNSCLVVPLESSDGAFTNCGDKVRLGISFAQRSSQFEVETDESTALAVQRMLGSTSLNMPPCNPIHSTSFPRSPNHFYENETYEAPVIRRNQSLNLCQQSKGRDSLRNLPASPSSHSSIRFTSTINIYFLLGLICLPLVESSGEPNSPSKYHAPGGIPASRAPNFQKLILQWLGLLVMGSSTYKLLKFGNVRTDQGAEGRARLEIWQISSWAFFWFSAASCCYQQLPREALHRQHLFLMVAAAGALLLGRSLGSDIEHVLLVELPSCLFVSITLGCLCDMLSD